MAFLGVGGRVDAIVTQAVPAGHAIPARTWWDDSNASGRIVRRGALVGQSHRYLTDPHGLPRKRTSFVGEQSVLFKNESGSPANEFD